jgi:adenosine deaminase
MLDELAPISPLGHIPPPEIRIGHGVYFKDTQEYFDLLRKYKVIIEINATSNEKLGNIQDITDIRYQRYLAENIPIVIATDGHGLYDTTIVNEDKKALSVVGNDFTKIQNSEKKFLSTR